MSERIYLLNMEGISTGDGTNADENGLINRERFDLIFKFIIIGDTSVGKSCILYQYLRNKCILHSLS